MIEVIITCQKLQGPNVTVKLLQYCVTHLFLCSYTLMTEQYSKVLPICLIFSLHSCPCTESLDSLGNGFCGSKPKVLNFLNHMRENKLRLRFIFG